MNLFVNKFGSKNVVIGQIVYDVIRHAVIASNLTNTIKCTDNIV